MILDRERKVQIEAELVEKEERERRKRERTGALLFYAVFNFKNRF